MNTKIITQEQKAWIVTADMGYGHQRAAYPFRSIAKERIITANSDTIVSTKEKKMWSQFQRFYETVSRLGRIPVIGGILWHIYDSFQKISPFYPFRNLSKPSFGSLHLNRMLKKGFAESVPEYTKQEPLPFLTTFFAIALAADRLGLNNVFCVVTDSDINRIWVANKPKESNITYFAPTQRAQKRLLLYGVPESKVYFTGFPLPEENTRTVRDDLAERLKILDPKNVFQTKYKALINSELGPLPDTSRPLTIVFAVGGAGAQAEIAKDILYSLKSELQANRICLHLVAGTRLEVNNYFKSIIAEVGLASELGKTVHILTALSKTQYFEKFNQTIKKADILWTKPSELSFYCALGLPIIMTPPIGSHEICNSDWLIKTGAGITQEDPKATVDWLYEWRDRGLLAHAAFDGFYRAPRYGTENIKNLIFTANKSSIKIRI